MTQPAPQGTRQEPARTYGVELYYEQPPTLSREGVSGALQRRSPGIRLLEDKSENSIFVFSHPAAQSERATAPPIRVLIAASDRQPQSTGLRAALAQSWSWPKAAEALGECRGAVMLTDVLAAPVDHRERMVLFENVLGGLLEAFPAAAIHWQPTQQLVRPADFLTAWTAAGGLVWTPGPINVRSFQDEDAPTAAEGCEMLMDTLGLAPLGLPDVQCRFRGLEPSSVSRVLYNTAIYLCERGTVIEDGHTVPGIRTGQRWSCRTTPSLALPDRLVLDLDAGSDRQ